MVSKKFRVEHQETSEPDADFVIFSLSQVYFIYEDTPLIGAEGDLVIFDEIFVLR